MPTQKSEELKVQENKSNLASLRKMSTTIHRVLANVQAEMSNLRKELTQEIKTFSDKDVEKQLLMGLLTHSESIMDTIDDLYKAMKALSTAPPGWGSALIDFLHQAVTGRQSPTQKAKFEQQLERVNSHILKLRLRFESSSMGYKDSELESVVSAISSEVAISERHKQPIMELILHVVRTDASSTEIQSKLQNLQETLKAEYPTDATIRLSRLVQTLKERLTDKIKNSSDDEKAKSKKLNNLEQLVIKSTAHIYEYRAMIKWSASQYAEFLDNLEAWAHLLQRRINEAQQNLSAIQQQVGVVMRTANKQDAATASKYLHFFEAVLGLHNDRSVPFMQKQLRDDIMKLIKQLKDSESSQQKSQSQAPIDSNANDRETLSKNPQSKEDTPEESHGSKATTQHPN